VPRLFLDNSNFYGITVALEVTYPLSKLKCWNFIELKKSLVQQNKITRKV